MTVPQAGGVQPSSFDAVNEFGSACSAGTLKDRDRSVHGSHALVILVESTLEAVSTTHLRAPIVGLNRTTADRIIGARRQLEEEGDRLPELQRMLQSTESIALIISESGYGGSDPENDARFFEELFPEWLENMIEWANAAGEEALRERVKSAFETYSLVMYDVLQDE